MLWKKPHWPPSISLVLPTATIHTIVTNSSQPLMESIKPCKYLQDKRASRQSIPIYRTMEGSTVAVFQVRKINKVSFGNRRKKINNNLLPAAPLNLSLMCFLLPSIILTLVLVPPFFSTVVQVWHHWLRLPACIRNCRECIQQGSGRQLLKKGAASGCDRLLKAWEITASALGSLNR